MPLASVFTFSLTYTRLRTSLFLPHSLFRQSIHISSFYVLNRVSLNSVRLFVIPLRRKSKDPSLASRFSCRRLVYPAAIFCGSQLTCCCCCCSLDSDLETSRRYQSANSTLDLPLTAISIAVASNNPVSLLYSGFVQQFILWRQREHHRRLEFSPWPSKSSNEHDLDA